MLNLSRIATHLQATFPTTPMQPPLTLLGSGFSSTVVETRNGLVFRIPKNAAAGRTYRRERDCLPRLQPHLPVWIPDIAWYSPPNEYFPYGVMGYHKLPGHIYTPEQPINLPALADSLAEFMVALHRLPCDSLPPLDIELQHEQYTLWRADVLPALKKALSRPQYQKMVRWWDGFLDDQQVFSYQPTIRHGDLWYENILLDPITHRLVAVLDFEDMACDDLAQDFAVQRYWGEGFYQQVLAAYQRKGGRVDAHLRYRIDRLWEVRDFEGLHFALHNAPAEIPDALSKLQNSVILKG